MADELEFPPESPFRFFFNTVSSDDIHKSMLDHDGSKRGKVKIGFLTHYMAEDYHELVVVGSIPELGEWDPAQGVVATRLDAAGWWLATVDVPKVKAFMFQWKWIVRSPDGSYVIRWEERSNRILYPQKRHHFIVAPWDEDGLLLQPDCPVTKGAMGGRGDRASRLFHMSSDSPSSTLDRDSDSGRFGRLSRRGSLRDRFLTFFNRHKHGKDKSGNQESSSQQDYKVGTM